MCKKTEPRIIFELFLLALVNSRTAREPFYSCDGSQPSVVRIKEKTRSELARSGFFLLYALLKVVTHRKNKKVHGPFLNSLGLREKAQKLSEARFFYTCVLKELNNV